MSERGSVVLFKIEESDPKARIQAFIDTFKDPNYEGFDGHLMRNLKVVTVSETRSPTPTVITTFSIFVSPKLQNAMHNMHGGALALLVDMTTTIAVAPLSKRDFWHFGGVTRTLTLTCLRPVPGGSTILVECEVRGIGKRLATITCQIRDETGITLAIGEHGKAALPNVIEKSKI